MDFESMIETFWPTTYTPKGLKVVCISDTHGRHRDLQVPEGDILIHSGDFTLFGRKDHAVDFNSWLGELPHPHKIVVNGNHENNACWKDQTKSILHNATFLRNEHCTIAGIKVYGTDFFWPVATGGINAYYSQIPADTEILVCHGPVAGFCDRGSGCPAMLKVVQRMQPNGLRLVVSGHIHSAHGVKKGTWMSGCRGITFVNASNCGGGDSRAIKFPATTLGI